jgi:hypothetical protein
LSIALEEGEDLRGPLGRPFEGRPVTAVVERHEMQEWERKLRDYSEKAEAKGREAGNAAENDLNKAWNKAEAASHKLETVGAEGWEHAKASFEQASRELAETWHKIHPEDK